MSESQQQDREPTPNEAQSVIDGEVTVKIVYSDNGRVRALRGRIVARDSVGFTLKTFVGKTVWFNTSSVLRIEYETDAGFGAASKEVGA